SPSCFRNRYATVQKKKRRGLRLGTGPLGSPRPGLQALASRLYLAVTVIVLHVPGMVLCRSSPSCSDSLCLPGLNCVSNSDSPFPKWTQDGVPLTMVLPAG